MRLVNLLEERLHLFRIADVGLEDESLSTLFFDLVGDGPGRASRCWSS